MTLRQFIKGLKKELPYRWSGKRNLDYWFLIDIMLLDEYNQHTKNRHINDFFSPFTKFYLLDNTKYTTDDFFEFSYMKAVFKNTPDAGWGMVTEDDSASDDISLRTIDVLIFLLLSAIYRLQNDAQMNTFIHGDNEFYKDNSLYTDEEFWVHELSGLISKDMGGIILDFKSLNSKEKERAELSWLEFKSEQNFNNPYYQSAKRRLLNYIQQKPNSVKKHYEALENIYRDMSWHQIENDPIVKSKKKYLREWEASYFSTIIPILKADKKYCYEMIKVLKGAIEKNKQQRKKYEKYSKSDYEETRAKAGKQIKLIDEAVHLRDISIGKYEALISDIDLRLLQIEDVRTDFLAGGKAIDNLEHAAQVIAQIHEKFKELDHALEAHQNSNPYARNEKPNRTDFYDGLDLKPLKQYAKALPSGEDFV